MPDQFWGLTVREFHLKYAAFKRAENRKHSLVIRLAAMTANYKKADRQKLERDAHALMQYPVRSWLAQPSR